MLFSYFRIAIPKRKNIILSTMCCVPVVVAVLSSKRLHTRCKGFVNALVLVIIPLLITISLIYFYNEDENMQSFCLMIAILFPSSAGILAFMQGSRVVVSGFGDRIEGLIAGVNAACCWCLLIPFGVFLPTAMSLPWQTDQFSASIFGTVIGGLAPREKKASNGKTPRKTPRGTPKGTPRGTPKNTPRKTPRKTPRERMKDIAKLGDDEFEAEIIRQRAEKRKRRHLKQRMAATSGD